MKTKTLFLFSIAAICLALSTSCGSTKGYQGTKLDSGELARIQQGDHKLRIKGKKTSESAYLVKVDTVSVGSYMKGFPKYTDVLPGERTVEIRHFQQWKDKQATAGAMFGIIGASIAESNNPHTHYKLTFPVEKSKIYIIMPITDETTQVPNFFVVETASNDTIRPNVVQIEKKKKN
jgi:hypothetical protein